MLRRRQLTSLPVREKATPTTTIKLEKDRWWPMPPKDLLRRVCIANIANHTGRLDYLEGGTPAETCLVPVVSFYCDNVLFNIAVPDYNLEDLPEEKDNRSLVFTHFGTFTKKIFHILDTTRDADGVLYVDRSKVKVKLDPANLKPMPKVDLWSDSKPLATGTQSLTITTLSIARETFPRSKPTERHKPGTRTATRFLPRKRRSCVGRESKAQCQMPYSAV